MTSHTNKWLSPGGCWRAQLGLGTTARDSLPAACHHSCHALGTAGLCCSELGPNKARGKCIPGGPVCTPSWGCPSSGCQQRQCPQPGTGRGQHFACLEQLQGCDSIGLAFFLKEQKCPRVADHPWNALCLLKHRVQGSDSNVSPPVSCGASPSSQMCKGESNQACFAQS